MRPNGTVISYNGEIYNYRELREQLAGRGDSAPAPTPKASSPPMRLGRAIASTSARHVRLRALGRAQARCSRRATASASSRSITRWSTAFFISPRRARRCCRFCPRSTTDADALAEYLTFQYTIGEKTLFKHVHQLLPGHVLARGERRRFDDQRYWDVQYEIDFDHSAAVFRAPACASCLDDSIARASAVATCRSAATCRAASIRA